MRSRLSHRAMLDLAPVVVLLALALPQVVHHGRTGDPRLGHYIALSALLVLPIAARRRFPVGVLSLTAVAMLLQASSGIQVVATAGLLVAVYAVAACRDLRVATASTVVAAAAAFPAAMVAPRGLHGGEVALIGSAFVLAAFMSGRYVRDRADVVRALTEAAARLERERDAQARLAAARERAQIAREMHDIIAHSLSVMVALADAAALKVPGHPAAAATLMTRVGEAGREALSDSRRVLGLLRDGPDGGEPSVGRAPQPGLEDLQTLVARARDSGREVTLNVTGPVAQVPATLGLTVYRIAQEATTNTLRHGRGVTRVDVTVAVTARAIVVEVLDDGRAGPIDPVDPAGPPGSRGHGIDGLRERVRTYAGTVTAGPAPHGGWSVRAELPFTPDSRAGGGR